MAPRTTPRPRPQVGASGPRRALAALACVASLSTTGCGAHDDELRVGAAARRGLDAPSPMARAPEDAPVDHAAHAPPPPGFPLLPGERDEGSRSLGDTSHGRLHRGRELEESAALAILPRQRERELRHATDELATLLEHAAAKLHAATGTRLWIGNVAREGGGDIAWSVSHNSGRDADVAFAYRDAGGRPIDPPDLVRLPTGRCAAEGGVCLDVARTWTIVRALVTHPSVHVQYVFVSEPIKKQLLEHAAKIGDRGLALERARELLRQPVGAAPHDDHLHVRVYCSERDLAAGCVDTGPLHPHVPPRSRERLEAITLARATLAKGSHPSRAAALARLALLGEGGELRRALASLDDADPELREAAALYVGVFGGEADAPRLVERFGRESEPAVLARLLDAVGELGGPAAGALLRDVIAAADAAPLVAPEALGELGALVPGSRDPKTRRDGRGLSLSRPLDPFEPLTLGDRVVDPALLGALAIEAASKADRLEPLGPLLDVAATGREPAAGRAAVALERITNHPFLALEQRRRGEGAGGEAREAAVARWRALSRALGSAPRDAWLVRGFSAAGYEVRALDAASAWELVRAVAGPDATSYNARRVLARVERRPPESLAFTPGDACRHHLRYFSEHRRRLRIGPAPEKVRSACARARSED